MALYLHCALCGRKQADGLLSGATWARVEVGRPLGQAAAGGVARVCPWCQNEHTDWRVRVDALTGGSQEGIEAVG